MLARRPEPGATPAAAARIRVWDPLLRIGHWTLVVSVLGAWATHEGGGVWHEWLGHAALIVVLLRALWGWFGPRYARFTQFVRGPANTLRYARTVLAGSELRHVGHNPLGGWMIAALLLTVLLVGASGWLFTTDRFWGVAWVEEAHAWLSNLLLVLIAAHVAGVVFSSVRHRENLVIAMLHGQKRGPSERDVA